MKWRNQEGKKKSNKYLKDLPEEEEDGYVLYIHVVLLYGTLSRGFWSPKPACYLLLLLLLLLVNHWSKYLTDFIAYFLLLLFFFGLFFF